VPSHLDLSSFSVYYGVSPATLRECQTNEILSASPPLPLRTGDLRMSP